jgi:hypothetical protein
MASAGAALFARQIAAARAESAFMRARLRDIIGAEQIRSTEDLVKIKRFLSSTIRWDLALRDVARPLLRAPAANILETGWGFCGENARAAILLLNAGGVPANRVYLEGERWGHVVVEHRWNGTRCLFDAHNDPGTLLPDELVGVIDSGELARFPNAYPQNPYTRAYRVKALRRWPALHGLRLPAPMNVALERPAVIKAAGALLATAALVKSATR